MFRPQRQPRLSSRELTHSLAGACSLQVLTCTHNYHLFRVATGLWGCVCWVLRNLPSAFLCFVQDVEIDIELAPGDQTSTPKTKELSEKDIGNQLHMLTNRHDKFLDTLREVKVCGQAWK